MFDVAVTDDVLDVGLESALVCYVVLQAIPGGLGGRQPAFLTYAGEVEARFASPDGLNL
jgi:hypothetical protein